ncbi:hypothetical protein FJE60_16300, partial [Salmonella enterica]|nr:hypothetical protein [Salmonella enterica]
MAWITSKELIGLPSTPSTVSSINRNAKKLGWITRQRKGVKGVTNEYLVSSLPEEIQLEIEKNSASKIMQNKNIEPTIRELS